jgi:ApeA N-terminal domain 1
MHFVEHTKHTVDLRHRSFAQPLKAKLSFGGGKLIIARLYGLGLPRELRVGQSLSRLDATSEDGQSFTLWDCKVYTGEIHASVITSGELTKARLTRIEIRYSDISEWFLHGRRIDGTVGETLRWTEPPPQVSATLQERDRTFTLRSELVGERKAVGASQILEEHVEFVFESANADLRVADVKRKARDLACLLSILTAYPISITRIIVKTHDERHLWAYFATFEPVERELPEFILTHRCFLQRKDLDNQWETVLKNFFQSDLREKLWIRLAGMQRYKGFWEYRTLGYVSLLDRYVGERSKAQPTREINRIKLAALAAELPGMSPPPSAAQSTQLLEMVERVFAHRKRVTFEEHYLAVMGEIDSDIAQVVDMTPQHFKFSKKVRDAVAHGNPINLKDRDFAKMEVTVAKIELLLTYWALLDFGLTRDHLLRGLRSPHCRLSLRAMLNRKELARLHRSAHFFLVSAETFRKLSAALRGLRRNFPCLIESADGELEFSEPLFQKWRNREGSQTKAEDIFEVAADCVRWVGRAYIECGEESLDLHSLYVFDKAKLEHERSG